VPKVPPGALLREAKGFPQERPRGTQGSQGPTQGPLGPVVLGWSSEKGLRNLSGVGVQPSVGLWKGRKENEDVRGVGGEPGSSPLEPKPEEGKEPSEEGLGVQQRVGRAIAFYLF